MPNSPRRLRQLGFTLIEAVVVIVVTAIIGSVVTIFMKGPIEGYFAAMSRLQLADTADAALRFVARDIRGALPLSFRNPNSNCLEFLPAKAGGRYCAAGDGSACVNPVLFGSAFGKFDVVGGLDYVPGAGDRVVFYNLGLSGNDAYQSPALTTSNVALVGSGSSATQIVLSGNKVLPANLGMLDRGTAAGKLPFHFFVVPDSEQAVFYVCSAVGTSAGEGTGSLLRLKGYGINATTPASCPLSLAGATVLADKVSRCSINWHAPGLTERLDVVSLELEVTRAGESVRLYQEVQVYNDP
ncbi:MAG: prepilin-type N-terminal cleavage/methylation domain-containing protein [Azonexus sp.]